MEKGHSIDKFAMYQKPKDTARIRLNNMGRKINIAKHLSEQDIKKLYKNCRNFKLKLKLLALMNLYNGKTLSDTADFLMLSYSNMKQFIKKWNLHGLHSLEKTSNVNEPKTH